MNLPSNYTFTDADDDRAWEYVRIYMSYEEPDLTPDEEEFMWTMHYAEGLKAQLGRWPTYGEVLADRETE